MTSELTFLYVFCGILSAMLGVLVGSGGNLDRKDGVYFVWFVAVQVAWMAVLYWGYFFVMGVFRPEWSEVFIKLAYSFGLLMVVFLNFFFIYFPRERLDVAAGLRFGMAILGGGMAILAGLTDLVHEGQVFLNGVYVADKFGPLYLPYMFVVSAMFVLGFVFSWMKLRLVSGVKRRKVFLSAFFAWIFLGLAFVVNVLLPFFEIYLPISWLAVALSLLFVVPTFFALKHDRFFGVSYLLYRFVGLGIFCLVFLSGVFFFDGWGLVFGFLMALVFYFGRGFFESRDFRSLREAILDLKLKILFADNLTLLGSRLEDCFGQMLAFEEVKIFLVSRGEVDRRMGDFGYGALIYEEIRFRGLENEEFLLEEMRRMGASFCLPLFVDGDFLGVFVLGKSLDKRVFVVEVVREFEGFGKVLELAVANVLVRNKEWGSENLVKSILQRKTRALKSLVSRQSDFLATTAHEFRTPLNIAMFQLEDAMNNYRDQESLVEDMRSLSASLGVLKDLTQRLFDFQRYDLDKVVLRKESVDVGRFVCDVFVEFEPLMKKRKKVFVLRNLLSEPRLVAMDTAQMRQVLSNLFSNAMKFAERIEVVLEAEGREVCVRVVDNGCGVADHLKERIFEKFQSGSGKLPDSYGLGMGLFIARKIVLMHGGRIEVSDTAGGGATFAVYL
ncbi:hypothetical protein KA119_02645 [Candidatus Gracilibacteria bacterium]|nr:hypothetical protein [Candidatus Gracilibacteria bacterium]